ncbi:protein GLUTAMINE DUMPER 6-like [Neltuma alba]|uniref:protein GLUTAMINE DUMPER 6-like n=1 Tax=Neltuma alba TaxID=207710 RepID=UPI0010A3374D|nr:protein GLUTAMINE DUMPER 6-like [Prosopis alba]
MRPFPSTPTTFNSSPPPSPFSSAGCMRSFKSPIPYLFGGLGLMLALIAVALVVLACSHRKRPSPSPNSSGCDDEESKLEAAKTTPDSEPRILVIMAGHSNPTYLAKPLSSSSSSSSSSSTATQQTL